MPGPFELADTERGRRAGLRGLFGVLVLVAAWACTSSSTDRSGETHFLCMADEDCEHLGDDYLCDLDPGDEQGECAHASDVEGSDASAGMTGGSRGINPTGEGGPGDGDTGLVTGGSGGADAGSSGSGGSSATDAGVDASVAPDAAADGATEASTTDARDGGPFGFPLQALYYAGQLDENDGGAYDRVARSDSTAIGALLDLASLSPQHDIGAFDVSADGRYLVAATLGPVQERDGGYFWALRLWDLASPGPPTILDVADPLGEIHSVRFSPDATQVAYVGDMAGDDFDSLYVVSTEPADAGGGRRRVSAPPAHFDERVKARFSWAPSNVGPLIVYFTNRVNINEYAMFIVDAGDAAVVDGSTTAPTELLAFAFLDFNPAYVPDLQWRDGKLYFDSFGIIYRVDPDGQNLEIVPGTNVTTDAGVMNVSAFGLNPDGRWIAFAANESVGAMIHEIYVADLTDATPVAVQVSNYPTVIDIAPKGPDGVAPLSWSPDSTRIAVVASWGPVGEPPGNDGLFLVSRTGAPTKRLLTSPDGALRAIATPSPPTWFNGGIAVMGDLIVDGRIDLYTVTDLVTEDQDPAQVLMATGVSGGDIERLVVVP